MTVAVVNNIHAEKLSAKDFNRIAEFVYGYAGIKLPPIKQSMVEGRLRKRLKALSFNTFKNYVDYVLNPLGCEEVIHFIDSLTTNKTEFFRERIHFDCLVNKLLPLLVKQGVGRTRPLRIWCAGCSTGEEPYTLSILLNEWNRVNPSIDFEITATDISLSVLKKASRGIYTEAAVSGIDVELRKRYLLRSLEDKNVIKISKPVEQAVRFSLLNLFDKEYKHAHKYDIIFCRNVLIYFDRQAESRVIANLADSLVSHGYLFLGHSETIKGSKVPLSPIGPTTFKKTV